jgi:hypothetical protein
MAANLQFVFIQLKSMKKLLVALCFGFLIACNGNADSKPTDLDRTDNDDTSAKKLDGVDTRQNRQDTTDTLHKIPQ